MPKCSFCGKMYDSYNGLTFVLKSGKILHYCSSKCQKNKKLGRKPEKVNWIRKEKKGKKEDEKKELLKAAEEAAAEAETKKEVEKEAEKVAEESEKEEKKEEKAEEKNTDDKK